MGLPLIYRLFACLGSLLLIGTAMANSVEPARLTILIAERMTAAGQPKPVDDRRAEAIRLLGDEARLQFDIKAYPWRRAQRMAELGQGLLWGVSRTTRREAALLLSRPIWDTHVWMVVRSGEAFSYHGLADLRGKTLSIMRGAQYGGEFEEQRGKLFKVEEEAPSLESRLIMLGLKRVDVVLLAVTRQDPHDMEQHLNLRYGHLGRWQIINRPMVKDPIHIGVARNAPISHYLSRINTALDKLHQRGTLAALMAKPPGKTLTPACPAPLGRCPISPA
ncbi:transporter substrate-binding domain-containing protein [Chitinimonas viridis]|uniref:Transporter substrate-binding domain-containing protein n=1 Tax=Chitinimonas viridis TaxID=664880 RepID=A0ABT8B130_9NEIS|nr:transporter substrate-binding domain-containing protein [Chitinimonas viridis]MDN3575530.1 transporter substrate-binding domain-containing protein [Chitinimonas viridis]